MGWFARVEGKKGKKQEAVVARRPRLGRKIAKWTDERKAKFSLMMKERKKQRQDDLYACVEGA